jgi:hypothetical protein
VTLEKFMMVEVASPTRNRVKIIQKKIAVDESADLFISHLIQSPFSQKAKFAINDRIHY